MSAELAQIEDRALSQFDVIAEMAEYARTVTDADVLIELTARVNAAREIAKVRKNVSDIRRMLMHAEVACLVRRYELSDESLSLWEKKAAQAFIRAGVSEQKSLVDKKFEEFGKAQQLGRWLHHEFLAQDEVKRGEEIASNPEELARIERNMARYRQRWSSRIDSADIDESKEGRREDARQQLKNLVEAYTYTGEPFTVEEVADALIEDSSIFATAPLRDGVRRAVREAVRASGPFIFEGESLPETIAVELPDGWVRVPFKSVTPSHLEETIREREKQIARDVASVDRLKRLVESVTERGCGEFEPVAKYIEPLEAGKSSTENVEAAA